MRNRFLLILSFVTVLVGQPAWTATNIASSADGAQSVFAADMDNDGDMDIVSASEDDNTIAWYENDGAANPSWIAADIATSANGASSVFVADMDNDGDMDIVSASERDNTIAWYENDGAADPSWTAANIATSAEWATSVFAADMDNDGDMDIVSASAGDKTIAWYENDGAADPSWTAADIATSVTSANSVFAADMDNDGDMDIVSASPGDDAIAWYENDGAADPSWTAADIATSADGAQSVFAADMDNDGDMDILSASLIDDAIAWYENDGAANPSWTAADIATSADGAQSVFAADMDNDGDMDILSASFNDDKIAWYENDGAADPSWTAAVIATSADGARSVFAADMDNDGDMDIVSASFKSESGGGEDRIDWYENTMDKGMIGSWTAADITTSADGAQDVYTIDLDTDGDMDVLSASIVDGNVSWYKNDGTGSFTANTIYTYDPNTDQAHSVYAVDIDDDGDIDVLSGSDLKISLHLNNGSESFTTQSVITKSGGSSFRAVSIYAADIDRDGDMDIVSASLYDKIISWFENDGSESFTRHTIYTHAEYAQSVHIADVDSDGDIDVLSTSEDKKINWYENNGSGSFTTHQIATSGYPYAVYATDVDNDGDVDVTVADYSDGSSTLNGKIILYKNDGSENFSTVNIATSVHGPQDVHVMDMDKDGDKDIVALRQDYDIDWYENNGSESFTKHTVYNSAYGPRAVDVADINGDGNMDIVSASYWDDKIAWYKQGYDAVRPTVSSVSSSNDNGTYKIGDVIAVTVTWSEAATVTGTPRIKLETGTTDQYATYASGSTTTALTFNYTVASGDTTADLDYTSTSALELNSGTIKDASGNTATLTLASPGSSGSLGANKAIVIDGNVPTVASVTSTKTNRGYTVGTTIPITITFSQTVTVTGTPQLTLETGTTDAVVDYASGTGTATLTFNYVVAAGHTSSDLDYGSTSALSLNSGTIKDASGNSATLTLPTPGETNSLGANKALIIDTTSPTVSTVSSSKNDAAYKSGEVIPINVNFDDKVYVTGTPQFTLETGTSDAVVDYSSGSESTTLTFNYTVASTHNSSDLDYTSTSALALNSGTVKDSLGNVATLTLPAPGATGSLGANKAIIIDNLPPTVTLDPADGSTAALPTLPISITFNEYVRLSDNTEATSTNVDALITLKDTDVNGTDIAFDATINSTKTEITIDPTADFASEQTVYVAISASLEDSLDHATSAASATLKMKDVIVPTVTFDPTNGSYDIPGNRNITLTFSESIRNIDNSEITDSNIDGLIVLKGNNASGADFNYGATINAEKTVITVDPLFDFSASSVVYVGIGAVVEDDADNAIVASSTLFITGIPDVIGPAVSNITSTKSNGTYTAGASITINIDFNEVSIVEGTPQLTLETGSTTTDGLANYSTGSGTKTLDFIYVVTDQHNAIDLDYVSDNSLTLNGGSIKDFVGNNANLALPNPGAEGSLGANKDIVIDNIGPSVSSVSSSTSDGAYKAGEVIVITVSLNENTIVTGSPQITLETGATDGVGVYSSGSGGTALSFNYTVAASDNSPDLDYVSTTALALNGGTMKDMVGLNADLTLPAPGAAGSLSSNKNIAVDNIAPTISTASVQDNGTLPVLADSKITFTTSESVTTATMLLESKLGDSVTGALTVDDPTHVSANLSSPFTSGDELTLTINALTDYAGNVTDGLVYNYNIALIADYNVDGSIDAADLTVLINGWTNKDYAFELGPAAGDVPNLKPATDGKYDIMDAAVLIRMWHWNLNKSGKMLSRYINLGKELTYINENNTLSIQVSKDVNAVDFYFDYPQDKVSIKQSKESSSDKEIILSHLDTLNGKFIMTAGYLEQKLQSIEVPYIINGREDVTITAIYRMFDTNGEVISQGTKEITLKPVPQEFSLHQNYPNPFNPVTTINYDLPQQTHVNLMIYDILGREVVKLVSQEIPAGYQSVIWNTRNNFGQPVSAGIYFYQFQTKDFVKTRKMVLLK